jgi:hypothetical protein
MLTKNLLCAGILTLASIGAAAAGENRGDALASIIRGPYAKMIFLPHTRVQAVNTTKREPSGLSRSSTASPANIRKVSIGAARATT